MVEKTVDKRDPLCTTLGMDAKGRCLWHSNVTICTSNHRFVPCAFCDAELGCHSLDQVEAAISTVPQNHHEDIHHNNDAADAVGGNQKRREDHPSENGNGHLSRTPSSMNGTSAADAFDVVKSTVARASQVSQRRALQSEETSLKLTSQIQELEEHNGNLQIQVSEQTEQIVTLMQTVETKQRTIDQELSLIKSVAMKRAERRGSQKSGNNSSSSHHRGNQGRSSPQQQQDSETTTVPLSHSEAPPRLPARRASETLSQLSPQGYSPVAGVGVKVRGDPPKIPMRQESHPTGHHGPPNHGMMDPYRTRIPQRAISQETGFTMLSEVTSSTDTHATPDDGTDYNTVLGSVASMDLSRGESQFTLDTDTGEPIMKQQREESMRSSSEEKEMPDNLIHPPAIAEGDEDGSAQTPNHADRPVHRTKSKEIAFIPSGKESYSMNQPTDRSRSNDADLGVREDVIRRSSVTEMQFDPSEPLVQEASQARSGHTLPRPTSFKRIMSSPVSSTSKGGSQRLGDDPRHFQTAHSMVEGRNNNKLAASDNISKSALERMLEEDKQLGGHNEINGKSEKELLEEKVFGQVTVATPEDDENDTYDEFRDLPGSAGYLEVQRAANLSPVSALTYGSYLRDNGVHEEEEEIGPRKALQQSTYKRRLPFEEDFDSGDDETDPSEKRQVKASARLPVLDQMPLESANGKLPFLLPKSAEDGKQTIQPKQAKASQTATFDVQNQTVNDRYGDGGLFTGSVSQADNLPHGFGTMEYENDRQYQGDWREGRWHGVGRWVNPNGDCYEGDFVYDARHGRGTYTWKNGNLYEGEFRDDKRQGNGTFHFANGNVYKGDFVNGVFQGLGRYTFEGGYYEGNWKGGRYHGDGFLLLFADGSSFKGEFQDGVAHGKGEETTSDGSVRKGMWGNGKRLEA